MTNSTNDQPAAPRARASAGSMDLSLGKKTAFAAVAVLLFFLLLEGALALVGIRPRAAREDPFVGFVPGVPLFVEDRTEGDRPVMVTSANKRGFFNVQSFPVPKPSGAYRIFCLGGSTTYGRPYDDRTSFPGWMRELLPVADPDRDWEVVNAGGISYASYRIAALMEELVEYQPDLFVVYTGHNEFLEERTYGSLRGLPAPVKTAARLLSRTRTWTALGGLLDRWRSRSAERTDERTLLPNEVQAKLDHSAGLDLYRRDDALREGVLVHFRVSLERMAELARASGAKIFFVTPACNLADFSPFKSEHTGGLDEAGRARSAELVKRAGERMEAAQWEEGLRLLDEAAALDPRFAEIHYLRGRALLALGRGAEAEEAFVRAREEDVCALRALTAMQEAVRQVGRSGGTPVVDFAERVRQLARDRSGVPIAGENLFLDHVHPTIEGNRLLAASIIDAMIEREVVHPRPDWGEERIEAIAEQVEKALDPQLHARALANLALTLSWAGKTEASRRLAFQALQSGVEDPTILMMVGRHYAVEGKTDEALAYMLRALRASPGSPVVHSQLGFLRAGRNELEAAAAHFFLATLLWEDNETYHRQLAMIMNRRGRPEVALASLLRSKRINPGNRTVDQQIALARTQAGLTSDPPPAELAVTRYPSGFPKTIAQTRPDPSGGMVTDGIWSSWYDGGGLRRFTDYVRGRRHGISITWDRDGSVLSRAEYERGALTAGSESAE